MHEKRIFIMRIDIREERVNIKYKSNLLGLSLLSKSLSPFSFYSLLSPPPHSPNFQNPFLNPPHIPQIAMSLYRTYHSYK